MADHRKTKKQRVSMKLHSLLAAATILAVTIPLGANAGKFSPLSSLSLVFITLNSTPGLAAQRHSPSNHSCLGSGGPGLALNELLDGKKG